MPHAFAPVVAQLMQLRTELHRDTYEALFAPNSADRQVAATNAVKINEEMQQVLQQALSQAGELTSFARSSFEPLYETVESLRRLVQGPAGDAPQFDTAYRAAPPTIPHTAQWPQ